MHIILLATNYTNFIKNLNEDKILQENTNKTLQVLKTLEEVKNNPNKNHSKGLTTLKDFSDLLNFCKKSFVKDRRKIAIIKTAVYNV